MTIPNASVVRGGGVSASPRGLSVLTQPCRPLRQPRAGFSIVEVIIAIVILTIGVLGLAGATAHIVRQVTLSDLMTERSVAFQTIVDRIQSLPYASVVDGDDSIGVFHVRWTVTPDGPQTSTVRIYTLGPGLGSGTPPGNNPQVLDSFDFKVLRR
jgi:prepilin-type N-terminal cleavage/methylation domain-containing protein